MGLHERKIDRNARILACLNNGADVNQVDEEGYSALYYACLHGYTIWSITLLNKGADPNLGPKKATTSPLHRAVENEDFTVIERLLNADADTEGTEYRDPVELPQSVRDVSPH